MKYSIEEIKALKLAENITPNVIYNRFDLFSDSDFKLYHYSDDDNEFYFEVLFAGKSAQIGAWLKRIESTVLKRISKYIFSHFKGIHYIFFENSYSKIGTWATTNHFRIELPDSADELDMRLSSKGRYNIKREKRILKQEFGEYTIEKHEALSDRALPLWERYFKYKETTHDHTYHMTPQEYCDVFHVTTLYSLCVGEAKRVIAIVLSCEQCPIVYIENLTYDTEYAKYSPGQILYDEYLKLLVSSGVKEIYLLGGDYSYKRRYGSIEETVYNCSIHRHEWLRTVKNKIKRLVNKK